MFVDVTAALYQCIDNCQYAGGVPEPARDPCCTPLAAGALDERDAVELAALLKVLADPARLRLLSLVAAAEGGEACACDLVEPVGRSQPTVSHHLSLLVDAGLLTRERRGRWAWYRVVPDRLGAIRDALAPAGALSR
ncbi:MAG: helix-turn-helix transcriptional regulator [Acidimicrobiales bacterium]|nr:helix-turn-helix transcriptional regulator [Acidimicrobiales bacterium]MCB9374193.1 helix-turn-helix transcriptional regulator [Microthrixaceae bacterium]